MMMTMMNCMELLVLISMVLSSSTTTTTTTAFAPPHARRHGAMVGTAVARTWGVSSGASTTTPTTSSSTSLHAAAEGSVVNQVTGEQLEMLMQEWEQPLVVDAYATVSKVRPPR